MMHTFKRFLIKIGLRKHPLPKYRKIAVGNNIPINVTHSLVTEQAQEDDYIYKYPNNYVKSSRYTVINFLPKNLFEQFQRIANFYFLCIALIQLFIESSVPIAMNIFPLVFVIICTMVKQGYEDVLRHLADRDVNNASVQILRDGCIVNIRAEHIEVGDIVKCKNNDTLPCDLVLLSSSEPLGICYATTASLDGETNLKLFLSAPNISKFKSSDFLRESLSSLIVCEQPTEDLYQFNGHISSINDQSNVHPLVAANILLRGATIRNTEYIYGCAVYTGPDTKMALNSCEKLAKFSQVELRLNFFLVVFLTVLLFCAFFCTILKFILIKSTFSQSFYIPSESSAPWKVVQTFFSFIVLFNYLIPISLYVTIELQKFCGSKFFGWDLNMYDEINDIAARANTSDLNEELGQIEFLFSDKTGTLTENEMKFRQCSIDGVKYQDKKDILYSVIDDKEVNLSGLARNIEKFFTVLALCHTVRVERLGDKEEYQASSPDEKAFLEAARNYGIQFKGQNASGEAMVKFMHENNRIKTYKVLMVLEFDSDRKRMSVILENEDGSIELYCKGAETAMIAQAASNFNNANPNLDNIMTHVTDYAVDGLRTLVIGRRSLSSDQFKELKAMYQAAQSSLTNRNDMLRKSYDALESELILLGCTGIEDKLQDQVKETIEDLREAGIQVWILTGDKEETAVNISHSTGHFSSSIQELRITKQISEVNCLKLLDTHLEGIYITKSESPNTQIGLIIDGQSLGLAMKPVLIDKLRIICFECTAVLCCRMTPLQKSEVVSLIKTSKSPSPVTAAIGDGANDVSMILEAHIGIGLFGKEGRQAVRAADYALARFHYLRNALLIHGHYYYIRIAILVQYFFYKNAAFIGPQLYFTFFSGFSAQTVYESLYLVLYNITLTSLPIFVYGLIEKHLPSKVLLQQPKLYRNIKNNNNLCWRNFVKWNLFGLWHSIVAMFGPVIIVSGNDIISTDGKSLSFFYFGTLVLIIVWITTSVKLCLVTYNWNIATFFGFLITICGNLGLLLIYQGVLWPNYVNNIYWTWFEILSQPTIWLCIFVFVLISLTPDIIYKVIQDEPSWRRNKVKAVDTNNNTYEKSVIFKNQHHQASRIEDGSEFDNGGFEDEPWQCSFKPAIIG